MIGGIKKISEEMSCLNISLEPCTAVVLHTQDSLAGLVQLKVFKSDGSLKSDTGWFSNIITDSGMDNFGYGGTSPTDPSGWMSYCRVGQGSTAPSVSDGVLASHLAESVSVSRTYGTSGMSGPPHYRWQRDTYIFPPGAATGNITEVGLGRKISNGNLSTRALVVDEFGSPVAVPVLAGEQLEVIYEIRTYITDVSQRISTMTIASVSYNTIRLPMNIDSSANMNGTFNYGAGVANCYFYQGTTMPNIGDHFGEPLSIMLNKNAVLSAYGSGLYYRDSVCTLLTTEAHYGTKGVTAIGLIGRLSWWQMSFRQVPDPTWGIPHNSSNLMIVTTRHAWARYVP